MNGELFKVRSPTSPYEIPCVSFDIQDEDFDVSIIVVATEGEDRYSNTLKDLPACKRKHTVVERRICIQRVFAYFNYSYAASIKLKEVL
jgi:hypothetical protein